MPSKRLAQERDNLTDLCWLLGALGIPAFLAAGTRPTLTQVVVLFVVASLTSRRGSTEPVNVWLRWRSRLPWQGMVVATGAAIFHWWARLEWPWFAALLLWPFLSLASHLVGYGFKKHQSWLGLRFARLAGIGPRIAELCAEAIILGLGFHFGAAFWSLWKLWPLALLPTTFWLISRLVVQKFFAARIQTFGWMPPVMAGGLVLVTGIFTGGLQRGHWVIAAGVAFFLAAARWHASTSAKSGSRAGTELMRAALVTSAALWVLRGFATSTLHGTPDARWYGTMLQDMILQTRTGVFPVFAGQTEYQFNGAIFPLRVAPAFHYLGALLDLAVLRSLSAFALQNLLITAIGAAATLAAYLGCRSLSPSRPWVAVLLAILFIACPGVSGLAYNTDLFMSWTTLPAVVIAFWATVRTFDRPDLSMFVALGGATGLLWWGHSPIALWSSIVLGSLQLLRISVGSVPRNWSGMAIAVIVFLVIAAYPLGSVFLYPPDQGVQAVGFTQADGDNIAHFVRESFPGSLLPLSIEGRRLSDFQLGYALLALWAGGIIWSGLNRSWVARGLLAWTALFLILLLPWPGLNRAAWDVIPGFVRDTTGNWAMNRLYLMAAICVVLGFSALLAATPSGPRATPGVLSRWLTVILLAGVAWSLIENRKFARGSERLKPADAESAALLAPENIMITRFAYMVFARLPPDFSHGVMDPQLMHRLWTRDFKLVTADNLIEARSGARQIASVSLHPGATGSAAYESSTPLILETGRRYLAEFDFNFPASRSAVLQLFGHVLRREYGLPDYGEKHSFGNGGEHTNLLSLFTSGREPEIIDIRIVSGDGPLPSGVSLGATVRLWEYELRNLPVRVVSWAPYQAIVRIMDGGWLETPRMFQRGYVATANGKPTEVRKTNDGLVAIAVPPGESRITLMWSTPAGMKCLFWTSLLSILTWTIWSIRQLATTDRPGIALAA